MKIFCILTIVAVMGSAACWAQEPIDESNWVQHPKVVAVRRIVSEIDSLEAKGVLTTKKKEMEYSEPYKDVLRQASFDRNGIIRKFIRSGGSDDSAVTQNCYYDEQARLRFVYIIGGAANGTRIQHRIYFDTSGNKIWEIQKLVEGPGYTFPTEWPMEDIVLEPQKLSLDKW